MVTLEAAAAEVEPRFPGLTIDLFPEPSDPVRWSTTDKAGLSSRELQGTADGDKIGD